VLQRNMAARIALGFCAGNLTLVGFAAKAGSASSVENARSQSAVTGLSIAAAE